MQYYLYSYEAVDKLQKEVISLNAEIIELKKLCDGFVNSEYYKKYSASKALNSFLDSSINILGLSVRSYNCLTRYARLKLHTECMTVGYLITMTLDEVRSVRNLGSSSVDDILQRLDYYELGLKDINWKTYQEERRINNGL